MSQKNTLRDPVIRTADLIAGALIREIRDANTWQGKVEAWEALLQVRMASKALDEEMKEFATQSAVGSGSIGGLMRNG